MKIIINNLEKDEFFKAIIEGRLKTKFPKVVKVKQRFFTQKIENIQASITQQFQRAEISKKIKPGMSIAIGVGSRGIANLTEIVSLVVDEVKKREGKPFIIPAMGSHGGANAEGQKKILENYGITEKNTKAPIISSMDVVQIGKYDKIKIFFDKNAYQADGIIPINRVKYHTDFRGIIESGLIKMLAIGFGKRKGAAAIHSLGKEKLPNSIVEIGLDIIKKVPIIAGVACLEDACNNLADLQVCTKEEFFPKEKKLLQKSKSMMARINLRTTIDVLIIDEMGKDISGTGFDPNIVGRFRGSNTDNLVPLRVKYVVPLRLTEKTEGNACGIGYADITVKKLIETIDFISTYTNTFTGGSGDLSAVKLPVIMNTDEEAIALAIKLSYCRESQQKKIVRIKNTNQLEEIIISEGIYEDIKDNHQDFKIVSLMQPMIFDKEGNII